MCKGIRTIKNSNMVNMNNSFRPGMLQLKWADVPKVRKEIMSVLGITSRNGWSWRLRGKVEPKKSEVDAIEKIFAKYGVTQNIWG